MKKKKWMLSLVAAAVATPLFAFSGGVPGVEETDKVEAATTSFRFVVMGDSRGSSSGVNETQLRALLTKVKGISPQPSFLMFTGDQVYGGSAVNSELTTWKNIVDDYYPLNMIYPALGNHEHNETVFSNQFSYLPSNQLSGYQRTAYYFDFGNARFVTVNSDRKNSSGKYVVDATQRNWLNSVLSTSGKQHTFVQWHVPAYPIGAHYGGSLDGSPSNRDAFWDVLDNNNVTAAFVGHEHNYNRRLINSSFNGNGYTFEKSIYQLTLGGAGAPLTSKVSDSRGVTVGPKASYHYMVVDIADGLATFKTYDVNNNLLDSFTVNR